MNVDDCITAYSDLAAAVFGEKLSRTPFSFTGQVKSRFDSAKLEKAIQKTIAQSNTAETELFNDGTDRGCRM